MMCKLNIQIKNSNTVSFENQFKVHSSVNQSSSSVSVHSSSPSKQTTSYKKQGREIMASTTSSASESTPLKETNKIKAPCGSWKSPITADLVSGSDKRLEGFTLDSLGRLLWLESRPSESGHVILLGNQTLHPIKLHLSFSI